MPAVPARIPLRVIAMLSVLLDTYMSFKFVIPKRGIIARGICCSLPAKSGFLADEATRNERAEFSPEIALIRGLSNHRFDFPAAR